MKFFFILTCLLLFASGNGQSRNDPKYIKVPSGYLMVLTHGDSLFTELERFAMREQVPSASFSGMGFVNVAFGFFNFKKSEFRSRTFNDLELASLQGSIAWQNGKPSIHAHGMGGDKNFRARAGHILSLTVSTGSLEVMILVHDKTLQRIKDEELGADVLNLVK